MLIGFLRFFPLDAAEDSAALFVETKRYVLVIIKIQTGKTLLDILNSPASEKDEQLYLEYKQKENERQNTRDEKAGDTMKRSLPELST
jgi:Ras GTPase-activating-like protein IQGAP2/3